MILTVAEIELDADFAGRGHRRHRGVGIVEIASAAEGRGGRSLGGIHAVEVAADARLDERRTGLRRDMADRPQRFGQGERDLLRLIREDHISLAGVTGSVTRIRDGEDLVVNGSKTWISNARRSGLIALLCKTDPAAQPRHTGISVLLVEHGPGLTVSRDLPKLGYKGVETCELSFDGYRVPHSAILGGAAGQGFSQMMKGLETGRIQVASRALGVATAALDDALAYAQQRESFGQPIWKHQSVGNYLADMATKLTAARQLTRYAAERYDSGERCDMEAGMAKLFASEVAMEIALNAVRIHGGYGYSTEYDVERYFRDAPLMIVGEGTNEIQRDVIVRQLVKRNSVAP